MTGARRAPSDGPALPEPFRPLAAATRELVRVSQLDAMIVARGLAVFVVLMALRAVEDEAVLATVERLSIAGEAAGGGGAAGWILAFALLALAVLVAGSGSLAVSSALAGLRDRLQGVPAPEVRAGRKSGTPLRDVS